MVQTQVDDQVNELAELLPETPAPIDVVYILGKGSQWQDNELRYSLRSIHQHLKNFRNIWIVGEWPEWLRIQSGNIFHTPMEDNSKWQRHLNMKEKILAACNNMSISDSFLFMNDDHFFLQDTDAASYPFYHCGSIEEKVGQLGPCDTYGVSLRNTKMVLELAGFQTSNFDAHCPVIYDKADFKAAMEMYDWSVNYGYVIKSLYCNTYGIDGVYIKDLKIKASITQAQLLKEIEGRHIFSIGDSAINSEFKKWMAARYPVPSPWENI